MIDNIEQLRQAIEVEQKNSYINIKGKSDSFASFILKQLHIFYKKSKKNPKWILLIKEFETYEYFGRGPHENYTDRCSSAEVGLYKSDVRSNFEKNYALPQENGNRTNIRYIKLFSDTATLKISSKIPFESGISYYSALDLFKAKHTCDLVERPYAILTLDYAQRGIGSGSCGPQTLEKYQLNEKYYKFEFTLEIL